MTQANLMTLNCIITHSARMNEQFCIRAMRLTVQRVLKLLALYPDRNERRQEFLELEDGDVRTALAYTVWEGKFL